MARVNILQKQHVLGGGLVFCYSLRGGVSRPRTPASFLRGHVFLVLVHFGIGCVGIGLKTIKKKRKKR